MAETCDAYFIGRIIGASGFPEGAFCRYWIVAGQQWTHADGEISGQTQIDSPDTGDTCIWSHPIDVHFVFPGIQGWPKLSFEVWQHDSLGRSFLGGYGCCTLPMAPGSFEIDVDLWRPLGKNITEELTSKYIGGSPTLTTQDIVNGPEDRYHIKTETAGKLHLSINLIIGKFQNFQVSI